MNLSGALLLLLCVCAAPGASGQGGPAEEAPRPGERDALCHAERGCYAVFVQRKSFREAGRSCREHGGTLATLHSPQAADAVHRLLASMEPRGARARLRLWIGLHRAPRQCSAARPLRGFVWVTGDQDGQYTNWLREEAPGACLGPRCVALTVPGSEAGRGAGADSFRWQDGACALPLDGYVCQYHFKGMCAPLEPDAGRAEPPRYTTPFRLTSTLLTHVPFGSVVAVGRCPGGLAERTALCVDQEDGDGGVGWSDALPPCSSNMVPQHQEDQEDQEDQDWCQGDHGCEHHCQLTENDYACFCSVGFTLDDDGYGCNPDQASTPRPPAVTTEDPDARSGPDPACVEAGCQHDCVETARGVRCTCPPGYQVGRDGRGCVDVDECRQTPCPQLCVNTPGTFHCACRTGYEPDEDGECADVDECLDRGRCQGGCQNTHGSYVCSCDEGYERGGSGECVDVDECQRASPCQQQCINLAGRFMCACGDGYGLRDDGVSCTALPEDEGYSALTPDPLDVAYEPERTPYAAGPYDASFEPDQELHWSASFTPDPGFENDPDTPSDWLTPSPDDRLHQREGHAPEQHATAPPPTQPRLYHGNTGDKPGSRASMDVLDHSAGGTVKVSEGSGTAAGGRGEVRAEEDTGEAESSAGKQKHDKSWLLVALLVPLCVFLVVMLALGIVYCTSCAVDKSQSFSDCYRWVLPTTPPAATTNGKPQA